MRFRAFALRFLPVAVAAACLAVRTERGFFIDEYTTWRVASLPPADMIRDRLSNGHFPTYFAIVAGWIRVAGDSVTAMRLPSLACALASVSVFHALARELLGRRAGLLAGLLFATHQLPLWAGQTARPYAMGLLATLLAAWGVARWWRADADADADAAAAGRPRAWRWLALGAAGSAATAATQALGALPLAGMALALAPLAIGRRHDGGHAQRARARIAIAALMVPMLAMSVPVAVLATRQAKIQAPGNRPMRLPRVDGFLVAVGDNAFGRLEPWTGGAARYAGAALFGGLVWAGGAAWRGGRRRRDDGAGGWASSPAARAGFPVRAVALGWFAAPPVAMALTECVTRASLVAQSRYHIPGVPGAVLLTAMGLGALTANPATRRLAAPAVAAAVIALQGAATAAHWLSDGDGPRAVARAMAAAAPPGTPVLGDIHPLAYEFRAAPPPMTDLKDLPTTETRTRVVAALADGPAGAPGQLAWVFVYNNKPEKRAALEAVIAQPPAGRRASRRIDHADATAVLLVPVTR